uniref:AP complex mu/sigma subunit domain-containing protein n=1 Tax=Gadus morhua TaxID=8049 RepID=A0A8C5A3S4_GADMO
MIKAILIFNNHGKPRLSKFYEHYSEDTEQQIIRETFHLVSKRDENVCNFLEGGMLIGGSENKLIYRHYATLYFVFCVDSSESELGILDLIQVFVETLDKCFENVCELDLIFHVDKVHNILAEMVMGGMVLETNMNEIIMQVDAQNKMEKSEVSNLFLPPTTPPHHTPCSPSPLPPLCLHGILQACVYAASCMLLLPSWMLPTYSLSVCALSCPLAVTPGSKRYQTQGAGRLRLTVTQTWFHWLVITTAAVAHSPSASFLLLLLVIKSLSHSLYLISCPCHFGKQCNN